MCDIMMAYRARSPQHEMLKHMLELYDTCGLYIFFVLSENESAVT